jgi:hypothetical protein
MDGEVLKSNEADDESSGGKGLEAVAFSTG